MTFFCSGQEQRKSCLIFTHLNKSHALLKFKVNYNFQSKSVEFLDTIISISSDGFIKTTFYTKPGKKCSYFLPSSCHPSHVTENIPYSLALRLKRICSDAVDFLVQLDFLKEFFFTVVPDLVIFFINLIEFNC